jgi:hypothetical protein
LRGRRLIRPVEAVDKDKTQRGGLDQDLPVRLSSRALATLRNS